MREQRTEVGQLWWQVNREIHERFRQAFRDVELPLMAMILLRQVHDEPGVTVSELARRMGTAKSHVSKLVDQLVSQGLLEKRTDPSDQRLIRLNITHSAIHRKGEMEDRAQTIWAEIVADLPDQAVAEVISGLQILQGALERSKGRMNQQ